MQKINKNKSIRVGIAASSSPFEKELFLKGVEKLHSLGFKTTFSPDIFDKKGFLAGSDERRAGELMKLFINPEIDVIVFARGGYGSQRVIPLLDIATIKKNSKVIIGFSDVTPLINFLNTKAGCPAFYGPVITVLVEVNKSEATLSSLKAAITGENPLEGIDYKNVVVLKDGEADAPIAGGCLSLINSSIGTAYDIETVGKILFIEDKNEKPYSLDRMLTQLSGAGKLKGVKGVIVGHMQPKDGTEEEKKELLTHHLMDINGPVIYNFPCGHGEPFYSLPIGTKIKLSTSPMRLFLG